MGYPRTGELGKINSVTNSTDLDQVLEVAVKGRETTLTIDGDVEEITGDGETSAVHLAGLSSWSMAFNGVYPKTAPRLGNTGLVTFAAGYAQYVDQWTMDFDFGENDITSFAATGPTWRAFMPNGYPVISGTYVARTVNDTALSVPSVANSTGSAAAFKLTEDSTDPAFTGSIITQQLGTSWGMKEQMRANYSYRFSGACTSVAGTTLPALLPAGVVDASDWGDGSTYPGPTTVALVWQSTTSRTWSGYGFLRSLRVECMAGQAVRVSGVIRGIGALTPA